MSPYRTPVASKLSFNEPATFWQRWPLRLIGLGVVLLTHGRLRNLVRYFGVYWNVGCYALAERPIAHHTRYLNLSGERDA